MQASSGLEALISKASFGSGFIYHPDLRSLYIPQCLFTLVLLKHVELYAFPALKRNISVLFASGCNTFRYLIRDLHSLLGTVVTVYLLVGI